MQDTQTTATERTAEKPTQGRCPIDHTTISQQKTTRGLEPTGPAINQDEDGVWHVRGFEVARAVLRSPDTKQAGFNADMVTGNTAASNRNQPILYLDGKQHQQQRKMTARFFAPKVVDTQYRQVMEQLSDSLVKRLQTRKEADLSRLSMTLAVRVAGEIVGLTDSRLPGMDKRLENFFAEADFDKLKGQLKDKLQFIWSQRRMLEFFYLDVKPAIKARKRSPKQDVISHLVAQNYSDSEILMEAVTFGAAGMITTREFISAATWHLMEQPALRAHYLAAPEEERYEILHEILRLEPIVGNLLRRATADVKIEHEGTEFVIPAGALINVHIHGSNNDTVIVGDYPHVLQPERAIQGDHVPSMLMSFGDGVHRCPGAFVAIQETDIFLTRLLALEGLHVKQKPSVRWSALVTGYEIRHFILAVD
ncbi:MAG TPA: cytochrome P450 [Ktedonobacteraceae bacterium]|nr:cytochrome P450 [Ktedonobacteraceae bacterium]